MASFLEENDLFVPDDDDDDDQVKHKKMKKNTIIYKIKNFVQRGLMVKPILLKFFSAKKKTCKTGEQDNFLYNLKTMQKKQSTLFFLFYVAKR